MLIKIHDEVQILRGTATGRFGTVEAIDGEKLTIRIIDERVIVNKADVVVMTRPHPSCY